MDKNFNVYRFFISPIDANQSLAESINSKEELFKKIVLMLAGQKKTTFKYLNKKNIFYFVAEQDKNLFVFNFAREFERIKHIEGETKIVDIPDQELKNATIIIHLKYQFLLIERNKSEFTNPQTVKSALEKYFRSNTRHWHHSFNLREITKNQEFWNFISEMDKLKTIKLTFNTPNAFFGSSDIKDIRKLLEEEKEISNIEELITIRKNDSSSLTIKGNFEKQINYVLKMGGEYFVSAYKKGRRKVLNSKDNIMNLTIPEDYSDNILNKLNQTLTSIQKKLFDESNKKDEEE
jgi:hypothetical protein